MTRLSIERFTKKMREKIERPRFVGFFRESDATERGMRLAIGEEGTLRLYWLVDASDGIIADAKFQAFGPPALTVICEIASELVLRKNYDQASRLTAELFDRHVRDRPDEPAFPKKFFALLNQAISAIDKASYQCLDIPFTAQYDSTPIAYDLGEIPGGIPGWEEFATQQKRAIIEEVIEKEIRPYIELDAGGIEIMDFKEDKELVIAYAGACTSCHSSTGSTLSAIGNILRARVHPSLVVSVH